MLVQDAHIARILHVHFSAQGGLRAFRNPGRRAKSLRGNINISKETVRKFSNLSYALVAWPWLFGWVESRKCNLKPMSTSKVLAAGATAIKATKKAPSGAKLQKTLDWLRQEPPLLLPAVRSLSLTYAVRNDHFGAR
jgi:hypothetical protein